MCLFWPWDWEFVRQFPLPDMDQVTLSMSVDVAEKSEVYSEGRHLQPWGSRAVEKSPQQRIASSKECTTFKLHGFERTSSPPSLCSAAGWFTLPRGGAWEPTFMPDPHLDTPLEKHIEEDHGLCYITDHQPSAGESAASPKNAASQYGILEHPITGWAWGSR